MSRLGGYNNQTLARTAPDAMGFPPFSTWQKQNPKVRLNTFAEAAAHGDLVFNCTAGMASLEALKMAGEANLDGKVLVGDLEEFQTGIDRG